MYFKEKRDKEQLENFRKANRLSPEDFVRQISEANLPASAKITLPAKRAADCPPEFLTREELRTQCVPAEEIPDRLKRKLRKEPPSASLFVYNLPKDTQPDELYRLLRHAFPDEATMKAETAVEVLNGRLAGQGFLHFRATDLAASLKDTLFGFRLRKHVLVVVSAMQQFARTSKLVRSIT